MVRTIGIYLYEGFQILDAAGPISAFELAGQACDPAAYRVALLAREAGMVRSSAGVPLMVAA
ncbi:MAG: GlxA family transcriptional regulator, partial [Novosphingobium sp.]